MRSKLEILPTFLLIGLAVALGAFFRLYQLGELTTPYWEEVALGYDAYSLLRTGRDHHGNSYPVVAVESFGDWKPAGYFYAAIPFVQTFGLNVTAVRLPAAIAGIVIIVVMALLARKFLISPVATTFIVALSPWGILFSRAAWEVNVATALFLTGITSLLYLDKKQAHRVRVLLWIISIACIVLAAYTYHALRVIAPSVFVLVLAYKLFADYKRTTLAFRSWFRTKALAYFIPLLLVVVLLLPLLLAIRNPEVSLRFKQTSIFTDLTVIEKSNELKELHNNSLAARIIYHRYVLFGKEIAENFATHFSPEFLFFSGDANPRHATQFFGQLYHLDAVLIFLGILYFIKKRKLQYWLLIVWLVVAIAPAAISKATPHALRTLPAAPIFWLTAAAGITFISTNISKQTLKRVLLIVLAGIYLLEVALFWRFYTKVYPQLYAQEWQYGYEEIVATINEYRVANPTAPIYVTRDFGRPAMYYWFYSQTDPRLVQLSDASTPQDQGEYLAFESLSFGEPFSPMDFRLLVLSNSEYQSLQNELGFVQKQQITVPQSNKAWLIVENENEQ